MRKPDLDDLEREALEPIYRPLTQPASEEAIERFPMDEHLLNAWQQGNESLRTAVMALRAKQKADLPLFRGGLRQPLQ